jgi:1,4-dihydroxy-2-naphthoyl-CoA hydrolase
MAIWHQQINIEQLQSGRNDMASFIGIEFLEIGDDFLKGRMPVDDRTRQPMGILHGGAHVVLAETLGSMAANLCLDWSKNYAVGLDINSNHLKSIKSGWVIGIAKPIHIGRQTQVWEIKISDESNNLLSISRLTMMVMNK